MKIKFHKKKVEIIKLKIIKCDDNDCWYTNKIGKTYKFFDKKFIDDEGIKSLWKATVPTKWYVYLEDTNYNTYLRAKKLKKINKINEI